MLNVLVVIISVLICCLLSLLRLPGMELLGVAPNWLLIWVVTWSVKRPLWQAAIAGTAIGWIYDGMTVSNPSSVFGLVVAGVVTASLNKERYIEEDFVSIATIVFVMAIVFETIFTMQYVFLHVRSLSSVLQDYARFAIVSPLITSLWTPAIYIPLNFWWNGESEIRG